MKIREIQHSMDLAHHSVREPFYCRRYRKPIMLAVAIAAFNQLSGINAVLYYTPSIFKMAGAGVESALGQSVIVGFTMLVFTMLAMVIIDHFGRRKAHDRRVHWLHCRTRGRGLRVLRGRRKARCCW